MDTSRHISIPEDLLRPADDFALILAATSLRITVDGDYAVFAYERTLPEVIAIQRLITLARSGVTMRVQWGKRIANQAFKSPSLFPLLAVLLCLDGVEHETLDPTGVSIPVDVQSYRKAIYAYKPLTDLFADSQVIICADSRGYGRPKALYGPAGRLISRADFDAFVERLLTSQIASHVDQSHTVTFGQSVATIVAELFENTDIHGKSDLHGVPFRSNGIRGMMFKRVELAPRVPRHVGIRPDSTVGNPPGAELPALAALEISVFDSGVGYFASYMRQVLEPETPMPEEWRVLHKCLERHYAESLSNVSALPDPRSTHTGMGLYEVLRALQFLKGKFEIRSGRAYGFRTFIAGDTQFQLESAESTSRPGMPKPVLLDNTLQYVRFPTTNELLIGSAVRVLIPLA